MANTLQDYSNVEFINDAERRYFMEGNLGEQVRAFLCSEVGQYLHGRARMDFEAAKEELFDLDPYTNEGRAEYARLKIEGCAAQNFLKWCADAIINGDAATRQLNEIGNEER